MTRAQGRQIALPFQPTKLQGIISRGDGTQHERGTRLGSGTAKRCRRVRLGLEAGIATGRLIGVTAPRRSGHSLSVS
jgi:hypothetical protein